MIPAPGNRGLVRLFVYGTLQPGGRGWQVVEPFVVAGGPATAHGRLFDTGRGYPAATFGAPGRVIHGAVLDLVASALAAGLAEIDRFEGPEYERVVIDTDAGTAWAYAWKGPLDNSRRSPRDDSWMRPGTCTRSSRGRSEEVSLESLAAVQSRIAAIQQQFALVTPGRTPLGAGSGTSGGEFAALLARYEGNGDLFDATAAGKRALTGVARGVSSGSVSSVGMLDSGFAPTVGVSTLPAMNDRVERFVELALDQNGKPYRMGAEADLNDPDPAILDCSELVEWAAHQVGVKITDGSWLQYLDLKQRGALMPVEQALRTPGALLFSFSEEPTPGGGRPSQAHVAISLGDGRTIEARGRDYGVGVFEAGDRFAYAGFIPDLTT